MDKKRVSLVCIFAIVIATTNVLAQNLEIFREIVVPYYADPYNVNISNFPQLSSIPIDNPDDGINWSKISLPKPCASGDGGETFIMVSRGESNNLLFYMEGGGACTDYITCKLIPTVSTLNATNCKHCGHISTGIFNRSNPLNPFKDWTIVYVPYSTGDVHSGDRVVKYINPFNLSENLTVYHVGHVNAIVSMRWIAKQGNFDKIVLAGSSAGGYGTVVNFYDARKIFNKSIIVINDAGPGLSSPFIPQFSFNTTNATWGFYQYLPEEAIARIKNGETIYIIGYVFDKYNDSLYCLYINQYDRVIGKEFLGYNLAEFRKVLLDVTQELKEKYPNNFCRYLPLGYRHTILRYPEFYTLSVNNVFVYQWITDALDFVSRDVVALLAS